MKLQHCSDVDRSIHSVQGIMNARTEPMENQQINTYHQFHAQLTATKMTNTQHFTTSLLASTTCQQSEYNQLRFSVDHLVGRYRQVIDDVVCFILQHVYTHCTHRTRSHFTVKQTKHQEFTDAITRTKEHKTHKYWPESRKHKRDKYCVMFPTLDHVQ